MTTATSDVVGNHPQRKRGKRPPTHKPALMFADHVVKVPDHPIAAPAPAFDWPMDENDNFGVCVIAGTDHLFEMVERTLSGAYTNWTRESIFDYYRTQNKNFDPATDADDNGMDIQTWLSWCVKHGLILGFAKVDFKNRELLRAATYIGLAILVGVVVDEAQMGEQFDAGVWDYVPGSPEDGGHCITLVGYDPRETSVTWAKEVDVTDAFISHQMDEAWFVVTQAHVDHPEFRNHFDLAGFAAAYQELTGRPFPVSVTPPQPAPTPAPVPQPTPQPTPQPPAPTPAPVATPVEVSLWQAAKAWASERGLS